MKLIYFLSATLLFSLCEAVEFNFYCDNSKCPIGDYQEDCPWSKEQPAAGRSFGYVQSVCFKDKELQAVTIFQKFYKKCNPAINHNQLSYRPTDNSLVCKSGGTYVPHQPYPTGLVDFTFVCANTTGAFGPWQHETNCPTGGNYRKYCPRCTLDNVTGFLSCYCFNPNKSLATGKVFLLTEKCKRKNIINAVNGKLVCDSTSTASIEDLADECPKDIKLF